MKKNIILLAVVSLAMVSCGTSALFSSSSQQFQDGIYYTKGESDAMAVTSQAEMDALVAETMTSELFLERGDRDTLTLPKGKAAAVTFNNDRSITVNVYDDPWWGYSWSYSPWYMRGWYGITPWYDPWYYDPGLRHMYGMYGPYWHSWYWSGAYWDPWYYDWYYDWCYDPWYNPYWHHYGYYGYYHHPHYPHYYDYYYGYGGHGHRFAPRVDPGRIAGRSGMPQTYHRSRQN